MRYHVLACDYDGTLALCGRVNDETVAALERLLASGRKLLLVTGRELDELLGILPQINLFEWVVAENGALLYQPSTREIRLLAEAPPPELADRLRARGVKPMSVGRVIVATWRPHETVVLETIRDFGLELQVIFNKEAVMVLPAGVNKAFGLKAALKEMNLSAHEVIAIGDAENDHAFLSQCEFGVAVDNALPVLKERADLVTRGHHGAGVAELIDQLLADDLRRYEDRLTRHNLSLAGRELPAYCRGMLLQGATNATLDELRDGLAARGYQYCLIDPVGKHNGATSTVTLGTDEEAPNVEEILQVLRLPKQNVVVNLAQLRAEARGAFFSELLVGLRVLREQLNRPHWLIVADAHALLPAEAEFDFGDFNRVALVTNEPLRVKSLAGFHIITTGEENGSIHDGSSRRSASGAR